MNSLTSILTREPTILVTADLTAAAISRLRELGDVRAIGWGAGSWLAEESEFQSAVRDVDVLVAGYERVTAELLDAAPRLRLIASIRGEPRANIDVDAATERGIPVLHTVGRTDHAVAEFTIGVMIALVRRLVSASTWTTQRPAEFVPNTPFIASTVSWGGPPTPTHIQFEGVELNGRTLGLIGLGSIGRMVVSKASGLGMHVIATDPYVAPDSLTGLSVQMAGMNELLKSADVISLHARLTPETQGMIDHDQFARMKTGAYLINTARAGLVERSALLSALSTGRLAGAAIDVFDDEPVDPFDPLITHPAVLPTPHIAGWTKEIREHHSRSLIGELNRIAGGAAPSQVSNPATLNVMRDGDPHRPLTDSGGE